MRWLCVWSEQETVVALPELLDPIQVQLLDLVSLVLARRPHRDGLSQAHINALHQALAHGESPALAHDALPSGHCSISHAEQGSPHRPVPLSGTGAACRIKVLMPKV